MVTRGRRSTSLSRPVVQMQGHPQTPWLSEAASNAHPGSSTLGAVFLSGNLFKTRCSLSVLPTTDG